MDREDEIGELAQLCRRLHNPPPPVPRERMWERIREAGAAAGEPPARARHCVISDMNTYEIVV